MRLCWSYELPSRGEDAPLDGAAPLHWDGQSVLLPVHDFAFDREGRAKDSSKRGYRFDLHRVRPEGQAIVESFTVDDALIAQSWSFLQLATELLLHIGSFHRVPGGERVEALPYVDAGEGGAGRGVFHQHDGLLVFADSRAPRLFCFDATAGTMRWKLELPNKQRYRVAPLAVRDEEVLCHASGALSYVELATGAVSRRQKLPRIDKLYPPVAFEGDLLFPYTNWSSGGVVRLDPTTGNVKWKLTKRGPAAPPRGRPMPVVGRTALISVNHGSSLVGVNVDTGEARWAHRAQWLYTPVEIDGSSIIFGTAGGYGRHLRRHDIETGETEWAVQMDGGCPYYARQGDHLLAGDWSGVLRRVRAVDGEVVEKVDVGPHLTGPPLVVQDRVYVLRWRRDGAGPSLVAVET